MRIDSSKRRLIKAIAAQVALVLSLSFFLPNAALASRSNAGGGDVATFDWGQFGESAGIAIGGSIVGSALGAGLENLGNSAGIGTYSGPGFVGTLGNTFSSTGNFMNAVSSGYNGYVVSSQASRAISYAGTYDGWSKSDIFLASSIGGAAVTGGLNPSLATGGLSSAGGFVNVLEGAGLGAAGSAASAEVMLAMDGNKIVNGQSPGWEAQSLGMAAGVVTTAVGRVALDPSTYATKPVGVFISGEYDPNNPAHAEMRAQDESQLNGQAKELYSEAKEELYSKGSNADPSSDTMNEVNKLLAQANTPSNKVWTDVTGIDHGKINLGPTVMSDSDFNQQYSDSRYEMPLLKSNIGGNPGKSIVEIIDTHASVGTGEVLGKFGMAVFNPGIISQLAVGALASYAENSIPKKQRDRWGQGVYSMVNNIGLPVVSQVMDAAGMNPVLVFGTKTDRIAYDVGRTVNFRDEARVHQLAGTLNNAQAYADNAILQSTESLDSQRLRQQAEDFRNKALDLASKGGESSDVKRYYDLADRNENILKAKELYAQANELQKTGGDNEAIKSARDQGDSLIKDACFIEDRVGEGERLLTARIDFSGVTGNKGEVLPFASYLGGEALLDSQKKLDLAHTYLRNDLRRKELGQMEQNIDITKYTDKESLAKLNAPVAQQNTFIAQQNDLIQKENEGRSGNERLQELTPLSDVGKGSLLARDLWSSTRTGLIDGGSSGLLSFGLGAFTGGDQSSKTVAERRKSMISNMLNSYAMVMGTAVLEGVAHTALGDYPVKNAEGKWSTQRNWAAWEDDLPPTRYDELPTYANGAPNPRFDILQYKNDQLAYSGKFESPAQRYERRQEYTGLAEGTYERPDGTSFQSTRLEMYPSLREVDRREFKPGLLESIGASMQQASTEMMFNTFNFGRPITRLPGQAAFGILPEQVSAYNFRNYVSNLQSLSATPLDLAISDQFTRAGLSAGSNNILHSIATSPKLSGLFSLQTERLVRTNAPNMPWTLQYFNYGGVGADALADSSAAIPYPNPYITVLGQTRASRAAIRMITGTGNNN